MMFYSKRKQARNSLIIFTKSKAFLRLKVRQDWGHSPVAASKLSMQKELRKMRRGRHSSR